MWRPSNLYEITKLNFLSQRQYPAELKLVEAM